MDTMALAHFRFLYSEPRAEWNPDLSGARAVSPRSMFHEVRCTRHNEAESAPKRPTNRNVIILIGSLVLVLALAVCAKYLPAIGLRLFGPPRVTMGEAHAKSSGKAQVDHGPRT